MYTSRHTRHCCCWFYFTFNETQLCAFKGPTCKSHLTGNLSVNLSMTQKEQKFIVYFFHLLQTAPAKTSASGSCSQGKTLLVAEWQHPQPGHICRCLVFFLSTTKCGAGKAPTWKRVPAVLLCAHPYWAPGSAWSGPAELRRDSICHLWQLWSLRPSHRAAQFQSS